MTWTSDELTTIDTTDELEIAPQRRDGTLRKPLPIWAVRVGDNVYVRAAYGPRPAGIALRTPTARGMSGPAASRRT